MWRGARAIDVFFSFFWTEHVDKFHNESADDSVERLHGSRVAWGYGESDDDAGAESAGEEGRPTSALDYTGHHQRHYIIYSDVFTSLV